MSSNISQNTLAALRAWFSVEDRYEEFHPDVVARMERALAASSSAIADEINSLREQNAALLDRYEDWRPISEQPPEGSHPSALIEFWIPATATEDEFWLTAVWADRPKDAAMWCGIKSPYGPRADHMASLQAMPETASDG